MYFLPTSYVIVPQNVPLDPPNLWWDWGGYWVRLWCKPPESGPLATRNWIRYTIRCRRNKNSVHINVKFQCFKTILRIAFMIRGSLELFLFKTWTVAWLSTWNNTFLFDNCGPQKRALLEPEIVLKMPCFLKLWILPIVGAMIRDTSDLENRFRNQDCCFQHCQWTGQGRCWLTKIYQVWQWPHWMTVEILTTRSNPPSWHLVPCPILGLANAPIVES